MRFTVELYSQGRPEPVTCMHGCRPHPEPGQGTLITSDGTLIASFLDANDRTVTCAGFNVILREEEEEE